MSGDNTKGAGHKLAAGNGDPLRPMDAVVALYAEDHAEISNTLFDRLSREIFEVPDPSPAPVLQQALAVLTYRVVKRTTRRDGAVLRNGLLERSGHPYARALLVSSSAENEALVEGGDPMNGPYMMLVPEIRESASIWDKLFFSSVQGRDVQLRFRWETQGTVEQARQKLKSGRGVRMKALAAGTGLSMILAYDRLVKDGHSGVFCQITDRDPANTAKTSRLLKKLAPLRGWKLGEGGISAQTEDIFAASQADSRFDVVTAVGILEYLQGHTCETTERRQGEEESADERTAVHLAETISAIASANGSAIVNSYRPHRCTKLLEVFGKRFDYRGKGELDAVMAAGGFRPSRTLGSGVIYDVVIYEKPAG